MNLNQIYIEDCRETLKRMPDGFIDNCITSPPYYGLRDYGTAKWEGGDAECDHLNGALQAWFLIAIIPTDRPAGTRERIYRALWLMPFPGTKGSRTT